MKRALIITYYWPPTGGSGVQRWVKFSRHLPEFGWQPVIYTPENPEQLAIDESLLADIPAGAEVIKTHITEPYALARKLMGKGSEKGAGVNPVNGQEKSFKQKLALSVRGNFFVPDPRIWWVKPSVKFLKKYLREHPVDVIVSTGPPQSMHLIGRDLHRATGLPWVADFRDPWTKIFYFKHLGLSKAAERKHIKLEQSVLDEATAIVSVTPLVQADFEASTKTPVHLITNGYDSDDFAPGRTEAHEGTFRIVHTGLFASDGNPLALWDALSALPFKDCLDIRLAGKVDPEILEAIKARGLEDRLSVLGYLSHEDSVNELQNADMLILPLRKEPEYRKVLPGKIFEYLAARKPVLGIGQEDGAAARVLSDTGAGIMLDWPRSEAMADFICKVKEGGFKAEGKGIEAYSRRTLTGEMVKLFESI